MTTADETTGLRGRSSRLPFSGGHRGRCPPWSHRPESPQLGAPCGSDEQQLDCLSRLYIDLKPKPAIQSEVRAGIPDRRLGARAFRWRRPYRTSPVCSLLGFALAPSGSLRKSVQSSSAGRFELRSCSRLAPPAEAQDMLVRRRPTSRVAADRTWREVGELLVFEAVADDSARSSAGVNIEPVDRVADAEAEPSRASANPVSGRAV